MLRIDRREFLKQAGICGGLAALGLPTAMANPLGLPIGLQLYTVRKELAKDFLGTLKSVAAVGYKEVEGSEFQGKSPAEIRQIMNGVGLSMPSAHYMTAQIRGDWEKHIAFAHDAGIQYMVNAFLMPQERKSLDDYKRLAELFNKAGEQTGKAGIQFCYHNHNFEFAKFGETTGYDVLLKETDPHLVGMELDCFWMTHAGRDPAQYLKSHPGRYPLLHIKDLKAGFAPSTNIMDTKPAEFAEVGRGTINWKRIFAAAPLGGVKHYFVEQDFCAGSPLDSIKISFDYLQGLKV